MLALGAIKICNRIHHQFFFSIAEKEDLVNQLHKLSPKKATQETDIPAKCLQDNKNIFKGYFQIVFNNAITSSKFL